MRLYFDVNTIIELVEGPGASLDRFAGLLAGGGQTGAVVVTSELSLAELLVKPLRDQDLHLIIGYNNLLAGGTAGQIEAHPVSRDILGWAARVRNKKPSTKLPDAIHIATAEHAACDGIITADRRWRDATAIQLTDPADFDFATFIEKRR